MKKSMQLTVILVLLLLLAACGLVETVSAPDEVAVDTTSELETKDIATIDAYQVPGFNPYAPAPTMLEVVEDRGDTLLVRHLYGETEVPKNPERIYADASTLDILISLRISPVGANSFYANDTEPPPQLAPLLEEVPLYVRGPVNLETVVSHDPDLILVWDVVVTFADNPEQMYELLSNIAPTVVLNENSYSFWAQATHDIANMLNVSDQAETLLAQYQEIVDAECERIRSAIGKDKTITFIEVYPDAIWLTPPGYTTETGFIPLGATQWAYQECKLLPGAEVLEFVGEDGGGEQLSEEMIVNLQADHLMIFVGNGAEADFESLVDSPLWQSLPAVQAGNAYAVNSILNISYYGALYTFEQRAALFTRADEAK